MEKLIHLGGYDGNGNMAIGREDYFTNTENKPFYYVNPVVVNHIDNLQKENASLKNQVETVQHNFGATVRKLDKENAELKEKYEVKAYYAKEKDQEIVNLKKENAELRNKVSRRNMLAEDLRKKLEASALQIKDLEKENVRLKNLCYENNVY
jgi:predicted RNase H-like nuclease (RuvC/YqgF family)